MVSGQRPNPWNGTNGGNTSFGSYSISGGKGGLGVDDDGNGYREGEDSQANTNYGNISKGKYGHFDPSFLYGRGGAGAKHNNGPAENGTRGIIILTFLG